MPLPTASTIQWKIIATQDDIPVRGNLVVSGDDAHDKAEEDKVIQRLDDGDVWAWCSIEVRGIWEGLTASDYLGGCSYDSEEDFKRGGYYDDMLQTVTRELQQMAANVAGEVIR